MIDRRTLLGGTAVFNIELSLKRLELLKQAVPGMQHAGALFNLRRSEKPH